MGKVKERKDKEVLLDYFQSQKSVTEKALAPQAVSSLAKRRRQPRLGARLCTRHTAARGHLPPTPNQGGGQVAPGEDTQGHPFIPK